MKLLIVAAILITNINGLTLNSNNLLKSIPSLPLGLFNRLNSLELTKLQSIYSTSTTTPDDSNLNQITFNSNQNDNKKQQSIYKPYYFDQKISHDPSFPPPKTSNNNITTFKQRYWLDSTYYKPGGPIFLLDGGETSGLNRLPFLKEGILYLLAKATGGLSIILEHRYYGTSFPVGSLSVNNLRYLTTYQALSDSAHFAQTVGLPSPYSNLNANVKEGSAWIYIGGSYAGACSAFARKLFPEVWWGAIASSAVTTAIINFWEYMEPIRLKANSNCIEILESNVKLIDNLISLNQPFVTDQLKLYFGLPNITDQVDFVNTLSLPLGSWQARNWDKEVGNDGFDLFCEALAKEPTAPTPPPSSSHSPYATTSSLEDSTNKLLAYLPTLPTNPRKVFAEISNYATYVKENIVPLCPEGISQDECFGSDIYADAGEGLEQSSWRSWTWQVCTEWGYFISAPPNPELPSLLSKYITQEYTSKICRTAFVARDGDEIHVPSTPNVTQINQWGSYELEYPRLAFVDGSEDPWLYATPHSPHADNPERKDTLKKPFKLIEGGVHHWDENSRLDGNEPEEIKQIHRAEIEFVQEWMREWKVRGRWRDRFVDDV